MNTPRPNPHMSPDQIDHFWSRVDQCGQDECWEWQAYHDSNGYGWLSINNASYFAHRIAYFLTYQELTHTLCHTLCHTCDNPPCCNPMHLVEGSMKDNSHDMVLKGRSARGETHSRAKLTENDVRQIRSSTRTNAEEAKRHGVSRPQISCIRSRKYWKHI